MRRAEEGGPLPAREPAMKQKRGSCILHSPCSLNSMRAAGSWPLFRPISRLSFRSCGICDFPSLLPSRCSLAQLLEAVGPPSFSPYFGCWSSCIRGRLRSPHSVFGGCRCSSSFSIYFPFVWFFLLHGLFLLENTSY